MLEINSHIREWPKSKMLSYDFIRSRQHVRRNRQADLLRGLQVYEQLKLRG